MKNVTFYIVQYHMITDKDLTIIEKLACHLAKITWRNNNKRITIACENKKQAYKLNELLWNNPVNSFIPHSLADEDYSYKAPIELTWDDYLVNTSRDLLINMLPTFIEPATSFSEIIDFVPYEESLKQQARNRYKAYRSFGFHLNTTTLSSDKII